MRIRLRSAVLIIFLFQSWKNLIFKKISNSIDRIRKGQFLGKKTPLGKSMSRALVLERQDNCPPSPPTAKTTPSRWPNSPLSWWPNLHKWPSPPPLPGVKGRENSHKKWKRKWLRRSTVSLAAKEYRGRGAKLTELLHYGSRSKFFIVWTENFPILSFLQKKYLPLRTNIIFPKRIRVWTK
jgi:hypothetical protein